jgi:hypothetical protein
MMRNSRGFLSLIFLLLSVGLAWAQVGIGTTTPTNKLDVAGDARIRTLNPLTPPFRLIGADANGVLGELRGTNTGDFPQWDAVLNQWIIGSAPGNAWLLLGNSGTNPANNFLGTIDNVDLVLRTNNTERLRVFANGYVGIGTPAPTPTKRLHVAAGNEGGLIVEVNANGAANLSANAFNSTLTGGGTTAHGVEVVTNGDANYLIGVGSRTTPNHGGTNVGVQGRADNNTGRAIGLWGAVGDATAYIGSVSASYGAGVFAFHSGAQLPVAGVLQTPTPPAAGEQLYALAVRGRAYVDNGQFIVSGPTYNPAAPPAVTGLPTGAGTRLLWIPERAAFRAVGIYARPDDWTANAADHADPGQLGFASFAAGLNVRASGNLTFVCGVASEATQTGSVALGKYVSTRHPASFQIGDDPGPRGGAGRPYPELISTLSNQFSARYYNGYRFIVREPNAPPPGSPAGARPIEAPDPTRQPTQWPNAVPGVFIAGMYNHFRLGSIDFGVGDGWLGIGTQLPDAPLHIIGKQGRGVLVNDGYIAIQGTGAFRANGQDGLTRTVNVMGSNGQPCQLVFSKGILVSTTCP